MRPIHRRQAHCCRCAIKVGRICGSYGDSVEGKRLAQESQALSRAFGRVDWMMHPLLPLAVSGCARLSSVSGRYCSCLLSTPAAPWPQRWRSCTASFLGLAILPQMIEGYGNDS
jgi:hypothetical protein